MPPANIRKLDVPATFACIGSLFCWSIGPIFIKYLTAYVDSWTQNLLRYSVACLFWLPFLLFTLRTNRFDKRIWRRAVLPAIANITLQSFWAAAFYYIDPTFMSLLAKSSIIWIAGFSLIFFTDERALVESSRFWFGMALSAGGVIGVLVCKKDFTATANLIGIAIAMLSSLTWGLYTISARAAFRDVDSRAGFSVICIYTVAGLCLLALVFGKPHQSLQMAAWPWACVVISGITSIALSHVFYYAAMRRIGATIPSLVLLATPFLVFIISRVVFGEVLSIFQWLFGLVLLAGSALAIWAQQHLK